LHNLFRALKEKKEVTFYNLLKRKNKQSLNVIGITYMSYT